VLSGSDGKVTVEERSHATNGDVTIRVRTAYYASPPD
jgi:hypothetical protein